MSHRGGLGVGGGVNNSHPLLTLPTEAGFGESWFRSFGEGVDNVQKFTDNGRRTTTRIATDSDFGDLKL